MAIQCKRKLRESIPLAHITMLSDAEVEHFQFIDTAQAIFVGTIRADYIDGDLVVLKSTIPQLSP